MARSIRIEYAEAYYHVMARGNRRGAIFTDDEDRRFFLAAFSEVCAMTGWRVHAWVLMGNHYHLFVQTPEANLVAGMKWLQNTYTRRFNVRHRAWGRLFGDRYKAVLVEGGCGYYYETMLDYIHLNPVRAHLVNLEKGESVLDYPWSSVAGGYALPPRRRAKWLACEEGLKVFGLGDTTAGRRKMVERLDRRAVGDRVNRCGVPDLAEEIDARRSHLRRGWYWGTQEFAERILGLAERAVKKPKSRAYRSAGERLAHGLQQAERWLHEGLECSGLTEKDLPKLSGSDPRKLVLAMKIWKGTTVSQGWLAERLYMKSAANVSQQLRKVDLRKLKGGLPAKLICFFNSHQD